MAQRLTRSQRGQVTRATNRLLSLERREFPSSSDPLKMYTAVIMNDGRVMCDCLGWTIKKKDKPRQCKHTEVLLAGRATHTDGEYLYLGGQRA